MSEPLDGYVRCRFCDMSFSTEESILLHRVNVEQETRFTQVKYQCPACGYQTKSFVFPKVED